jgi:hypothetical protein
LGLTSQTNWLFQTKHLVYPVKLTGYSQQNVGFNPANQLVIPNKTLGLSSQANWLFHTKQ